MDVLTGSLDKLCYNPENRAQLDEATLTKIAKGIAEGMNHLAKRASFAECFFRMD